MEIKIALTNLGKYNEGSLVYEWLELPATQEEINETLEAIGINEEYEEFFISDYEAPFQIGEYASINKLNEIAEQLQNVELVDFRNGYNYDYVDTLYTIKNLASELDMDQVVEDYFTIEEVEELELYPKNDNGTIDLMRMYHFLGDVNGNTEVVRINGYGNLETVHKDDLADLQEEIMSEFVKSLDF